MSKKKHSCSLVVEIYHISIENKATFMPIGVNCLAYLGIFGCKFAVLMLNIRYFPLFSLFFIFCENMRYGILF
jgi:hypothetical protein